MEGRRFEVKRCNEYYNATEIICFYLRVWKIVVTYFKVQKIVDVYTIQ